MVLHHRWMAFGGAGSMILPVYASNRLRRCSNWLRRSMSSSLLFSIVSDPGMQLYRHTMLALASSVGRDVCPRDNFARARRQAFIAYSHSHRFALQTSESGIYLFRHVVVAGRCTFRPMSMWLPLHLIRSGDAPFAPITYLSCSLLRYGD